MKDPGLLVILLATNRNDEQKTDEVYNRQKRAGNATLSGLSAKFMTEIYTILNNRGQTFLATRKLNK